MRKERIAQKGFTLIEVLIVVVIIAVLASLILPRFMGQSERAVIGEAQQMLGAIRRGELRWQDMAGDSSNWVGITECGAGEPCDDSQWALLGISPPSGGSFKYYAGAGNILQATRVGGRYAGARVILFVISGGWACTDGYTELPNDRGCTV